MSGFTRFVRVINAGQRSRIDVRGTTVFLRQCDIPEVQVTTRTQQIVDGMGLSYTVPMAPSEKLFAASEFDQVVIENNDIVPATVEFLIGYGDFFRPVPDIVSVEVDNINPVKVEVVASQPSASPSASVDSINDVSGFGQGNLNAVQALPVNGSRVRAIVTNPASNTDTLRVGDAGVDVDNGIPLIPGESVPWDSTAPMFVCSEGATAAQVLAVTEFNL